MKKTILYRLKTKARLLYPKDKKKQEEYIEGVKKLVDRKSSEKKSVIAQAFNG